MGRPRPQARERPPATRLGGEPIRTCVGCRRRRPRSELLRVVRLSEGGVAIEVPGRSLQGRGAYVCPDEACVAAALGSGGLRRTLRLKGSLPEDLGDRLLRTIEQAVRGRDGQT